MRPGSYVLHTFPSAAMCRCTASLKVEELTYKAGAIWGGYLMPWDKWVYGITIGQQYLMENTTLGIPGIVQSEGVYCLTTRSNGM